MSIPSETYHRLEEAAYLVARHPDYPGKEKVVRSCMGEIETRYQTGCLDLAQSNHLIAILLGQENPDATADIN